MGVNFKKKKKKKSSSLNDQNEIGILKFKHVLYMLPYYL